MRNPLSALVDLVLKRVWYVHETTYLTLQATPAACLQAMAIAAKPSVDRLQLRDVFGDGRRYYLELHQGGFRLKCRSATWLLFFRRKRAVTLLYGKFERVDERSTRMNLSAHIALPYLLEALLYPFVLGSIILPFDLWYMWFRAGVVVLVLALIWNAHRAQAKLQAVDIVYFIERALEDFAQVPTLEQGSLHIADDTLHREFRQEWEKFYKEHERD